MAVSEKLRVLVVGSDSNSMRILNEVARDLENEAEVQVLRDEREALEFLEGAAGSQVTGPQLILLDGCSEGVDMEGFLRAVKSNPELLYIPTVALLEVGSEMSLKNFYELNCNCVVPKPSDTNSFVELLKALKTFWLGVVTLSTPRDL